MPLLGDLRTMALSDLLHWAGEDKKTGVLELERNKVCRRVEFRKGWIGACSSSDPASRLGQFLLSRGKITEQHLRDALARQQQVRKNLGWILLEMGVLTRQELTRQISSKAEETMYGLFEWHDAVFRFNEGATLDPDHIEVSLSVEEILNRGQQRIADLKEIRKVFSSSGVVLRRADREIRSKSLERPMARRILESIDGERTLAEVLLHAGASEFVILKFLSQLHTRKVVEIKEVRQVLADSTSLLDATVSGPCVDTLPWKSAELAAEEPDAPDAPPDRLVAEPDVVGFPAMPSQNPAGIGGIDFEIHVAQRLVSRGEFQAALELLNAVYRAQPDDNFLRRLLAKTEEAYVQTARRHALAFHKIPVMLEATDEISTDTVRPEESFLMSVIDGRCDIQSILWITPLREVDVLMALRRMIDRGLIGFREPEPEGAAPETCEVSV